MNGNDPSLASRDALRSDRDGSLPAAYQDRRLDHGDQIEMPGRMLSIVAGTIAIFVAASFLIWIKDVPRIPACTGSSVQFFNPSSAGRWLDAGVAACAALTITVSLSRRSHRLAACIASVMVILSICIAAAAVAVHGGHISECWNF